MSSHFPKRLPEKLMAIRERYDLTAAEPSKSLHAATMDAYEKGNVDLRLSVLLTYARLAVSRFRTSSMMIGTSGSSIVCINVWRALGTLREDAGRRGRFELTHRLTALTRLLTTE